MYLSFLRPLTLPRASTLQRFLSTSSTSTTKPSSSQSAGATPISLESSPKSSPQSSSLPYHVERTPSSNLPIYLLAKRGGNLKQTRLRKIEGDINTLRVQLRDALKVDDKEIVINQLTKQIIIRVS